jgi:hypothetical protein
MISVAERASGRGTPNGGTGKTTSPSMPRASRLVARTVTPGQVCTIRESTAAHASARCSQLSTTSSTRASRSRSVTESINPTVGRSCTPTAAATAAATMSGSATAARSTQPAPSENRRDASVATSTASRVFPLPPAPVRVSTRAPASSSPSAVRSPSRPTRVVTAVGSPDPCAVMVSGCVTPAPPSTTCITSAPPSLLHSLSTGKASPPVPPPGPQLHRPGIPRVNPAARSRCQRLVRAAASQRIRPLASSTGCAIRTCSSAAMIWLTNTS